MPAKDIAAPLHGDDYPEISVTRLSAADRRRSARESLLLVMVALQTAVILGMAIGGAYAYQQVMTKADMLNDVVEIVNNPASIVQQPGVSTALAQVLRETASAFFLGTPNGTISAFVADVAETNFHTIGQDIKPLAAAVFRAFQSRQADPSCTQLVQCSQWGPMQCPNGNWVNCQPNVAVNCADCPYGAPMELASIIESVAGRVAQLQPIASAPSGPAALSDGVFRLNSILSWVAAQGNVTSWKLAAHQCDALAAAVDNVNWSANYTKHDGRSASWDANSQVNSVTRELRRYCPIIANMGTLAAQGSKP